MENKMSFTMFSVIMVLLSFSHLILAIKDDGDKPLLNSDDEFDAVIATAESPSSRDQGNKFIRNHSKQEIEYLKNCSKNMGDVPDLCFEEVLAQILRNKSVSKDCCLAIVKGGKECHMEWMKAFFQLFQLERFSSKRFFKSNKIWSLCSTEIGAVSPFSG